MPAVCLSPEPEINASKISYSASTVSLKRRCVVSRSCVYSLKKCSSLVGAISDGIFNSRQNTDNVRATSIYGFLYYKLPFGQNFDILGGYWSEETALSTCVNFVLKFHLVFGVLPV
jgi:hypothetical protein